MTEDVQRTSNENLKGLNDEQLRVIIREGTTYGLIMTGGDVEIATSVPVSRTETAQRAHEVLMERVEDVVARVRASHDYVYTSAY